MVSEISSFALSISANCPSVAHSDCSGAASVYVPLLDDLFEDFFRVSRAFRVSRSSGYPSLTSAMSIVAIHGGETLHPFSTRSREIVG